MIFPVKFRWKGNRQQIQSKCNGNSNELFPVKIPWKIQSKYHVTALLLVFIEQSAVFRLQVLERGAVDEVRVSPPPFQEIVNFGQFFKIGEWWWW